MKKTWLDVSILTVDSHILGQKLGLRLTGAIAQIEDNEAGTPLRSGLHFCFVVAIEAVAISSYQWEERHSECWTRQHDQRAITSQIESIPFVDVELRGGIVVSLVLRIAQVDHGSLGKGSTDKEAYNITRRCKDVEMHSEYCDCRQYRG